MKLVLCFMFVFVSKLYASDMTCNSSSLKIGYEGPTGKVVNNFIFLSKCNKTEVKTFNAYVYVDDFECFFDKSRELVTKALSNNSRTKPNKISRYIFISVDKKNYTLSLEKGLFLASEISKLIDNKEDQAFFYSSFIARVNVLTMY